MEGGLFSKWAFRLSAVHIRPKKVAASGWTGWWFSIGGSRIGASHVRSPSFKDGVGLFFNMGSCRSTALIILKAYNTFKF
eukprot:3222140-Pyramimonas_sp.AAC.1